LHYYNADAVHGELLSNTSGWTLMIRFRPRVKLSGCHSNDSHQNVNLIDGLATFTFNKNDTSSEPGGFIVPITLKQSIVFTVCGIIIAGFFCVAAGLRLRNRLRKQLRKRKTVVREATKTKSRQAPSHLAQHHLAPLSRQSSGAAAAAAEAATPPVFSFSFSSSRQQQRSVDFADSTDYITVVSF
uniref:CUB domain-containing protein n=1 Tax=Macrostomum lignano TaxID=282301 RepID=A0A1I8HXK2_9PLAT